MGLSPIPSIIPRNAVEYQQLQILHQIQNHLIPNYQAPWLLILLEPIPLEWRLKLYFIFSHIPLPHSPFITIFLIMFWQILVIIFCILAILLILYLAKVILRIINTFLLNMSSGKSEDKKFLELTFPSDVCKSAYATEQLYTLFHSLARRRKSFFGFKYGSKKEYALEIVSTKNDGIRFLLVADESDSDILKKSLLSYLPGIKIKEVNDYLKENINVIEKQKLGITELKVSSHFALPLNSQKALSEHDLIAFITGNMTNLTKNGLIAFQIISSPILDGIQTKQIREMNNLRRRIYKGEPLTLALQKKSFEKVASIPGLSFIALIFRATYKVLSFSTMFAFSMAIAAVDSSGKSVPFLQQPQKTTTQELLNPYEQELRTVVKEKIDQQLFETTIRILVVGESVKDFNNRMTGLISSFGSMNSAYQTFTTKGSASSKFSLNHRISGFKQRTLSRNTPFNQNPILSTSELSDIYHFPYANTTKTEDIVKSLSPELPAPLSLKNGRKLDVIFAKNNYGNSKTDIGLTDEERARHIYLLGRTGSGKSTIIYHMAKEDIQKGRGVCVIDPHGDLAENLLATVPIERINDVIYFNPFDLKYPIGINLLELPDNLEDEELELEKELVAESVISVFRRIFSKEEYTNAHRIEYILRNTIYTSFAVPDRTLFTIYKLLTNKRFRDEIVKNLDDQDLKDFWNNEFGKASNWQVIKMISGVTAKVGRFLYSPITKRIIDQPKSTINFDQILDQGKILICNLSEGKIGEDTSQLLGLTIIAKVHQAALRRSRKEATKRKPFYLFVDEFQNFATTSFTRILSGGRKFGLRLTLAEQSSAQQQDKQVVNVILANTGTVICFATASSLDAQMMESQFAPLITRHNLANLPKYQFFINMSATTPEEPFSGETIEINATKNPQKVEKLIAASRKNYATTYAKPKKEKKEEIVKKDDKQMYKKTQNKQKNSPSKSFMLGDEEDQDLHVLAHAK